MATALLESLLRTRFGFQEFRAGQREAIETLLSHGKLLCIHPTGRGKSLLYQLPACLLDGLTVVISPLLALMRDQIDQLNNRFQIPAAAINTDQSEEENASAREAALKGTVKILFLAPEQLDHVDRFSFLLTLNISLIVVDEAHCISTWGHDFRPSYRQICNLLSHVSSHNPHIKILGLTATANNKVEQDIRKQLGGTHVVTMRDTMDRPNIQLSVLPRRGLAEKLATCAHLVSTLEGCGLIYCATRENVELVTDFLQAQQLAVAGYHAGFAPEDKKRLQKAFLEDQYKALIATNALGMGIDKGNLRFIIHFDVPGSITAYYQEVGRCGRDGLPARGIVLFDPSDQRIQEYFIESAIPSQENFEQVLLSIRSAEQKPNLTAIKRLSGLHPTRVTIVLAELLEQGFITKSSLQGVQVYAALDKQDTPDLSRYERQRFAKTDELQKMVSYGRQTTGCRMAMLREALGDVNATMCGHCDICSPKEAKRLSEDAQVVSKWLLDRPLPISPIALYKVSAGISILDSKARSPLFVRFMKERAVVLSYQEMDPDLIDLLLRHFGALIQDKTVGAIIPIPSTTWKARESILELLSNHFNIPVLDVLHWKELPLKRQGELLNNDQRHHNVHQRMEACFSTPIPPGCLILFDDYTGSGNTLKEAARALRATKTIANEIIPFTIAAVKWHLGKPGFA